jgi:hypothetical protein
VQALDQSLDADHDAVAIRGHRVRDAVSGVDVQKKILTIQPASSRALGQPRCRTSRQPSVAVVGGRARIARISEF